MEDHLTAVRDSSIAAATSVSEREDAVAAYDKGIYAAYQQFPVRWYVLIGDLFQQWLKRLLTIILLLSGARSSAHLRRVVAQLATMGLVLVGKGAG
jgi:hypothetical protein